MFCLVSLNIKVILSPRHLNAVLTRYDRAFLCSPRSHLSARTDSLLRQQVNTNDLSGSQPFFPPGRTMVQVSRAALWSKCKSHGPHACRLHIKSSIQTNQIYNIIYRLNIMISERLHVFKLVVGRYRR